MPLGHPSLCPGKSKSKSPRRNRASIIAQALMLLVCIAVVAMWVRSHRAYDDFSGTVRTYYVEILSADGEFQIDVATHVPLSLAMRHDTGDESLADGFGPVYRTVHPIGANLQLDTETQRFGFTLARGEYDFLMTGEEASGSVSPMAGIRAPDWSVALILGLVASPGVYRRVRPKRTNGMCLNCGYDLRATPDRCPECGTIRNGAR